eukprot:TRINITY_DN11786_c0_g1_i1.p1 TRINITY_DN11786_c0_g1~~TRINITY_DN11786_c0_g1_i1.p1  ORF type:complete len:509 (+),score=109.10 TRINITY_DN11786_c0_g1_i1:66-1592(+)
MPSGGRKSQRNHNAVRPRAESGGQPSGQPIGQPQVTVQTAAERYQPILQTQTPPRATNTRHTYPTTQTRQAIQTPPRSAQMVQAPVPVVLPHGQVVQTAPRSEQIVQAPVPVVQTPPVNGQMVQGPVPMVLPPRQGIQTPPMREQMVREPVPAFPSPVKPESNPAVTEEEPSEVLVPDSKVAETLHEGVPDLREDAEGLPEIAPEATPEAESEPTAEVAQVSAPQGAGIVESLRSKVTKRRSQILDSARHAKAVATDYAESAKSEALKSYDRLRSEGVKVWAGETAQAVASTAQATVASLRKNADAATIKALKPVVQTLGTCRASICSRTLAVLDISKSSYARTRTAAIEAATSARSKSADLSSKAVEMAKDGQFQATAAGAAGGAATLGVGGAATGLTTGAVFGAAVGLVPALFTFGLSIPIGAAIGGSTGLVVGTAVGTTAGAVGGGAAGYGLHAKRADIRDGAQKTLSKVSSTTEFVKDKASVVRSRLLHGYRASTGGTDTPDTC